MIKKIAHVVNYIVRNNPWHLVPKYLFLAILYQTYKRITQGIVTKKLFNGKKLFLYPNNPICSAFAYTAYPDKAEIMALRNNVNDNTIFLDVGANIGAYSILLADKVKAVFAFEAHPVTAHLCQMNFLLNNLPMQQVIHTLVSDNLETKWLSNLGNGSALNSQVTKQDNSISVPSLTLDEFVLQQGFSSDVNFILKIDVEGFEHEVLFGAKSLLTHYDVRAIIFESFSDKNEEILHFLQELGYHIKPIGQHNYLAEKYRNLSAIAMRAHQISLKTGDNLA